MRSPARLACPALAAFVLAMATSALAGAVPPIPPGAAQAVHPQATPEKGTPPAKVEAPPAKKTPALAKPSDEPAVKPAARTTASEPQDEGRPGIGGGGSTGPKDGAASLQEVLSRINAAVAGQHAKSTTGPDVASPPPAPRPRARAPKPAARKAKPQALLKWDPALTSGGVALSWDDQLNPRRARGADLGVRLVWPSRLP